MSRSVKHTPRWGERKGRESKRSANRAVRRNKLREDIPQYAGYKRLAESWDICDYERVHLRFEEYCRDRYRFWLRRKTRCDPGPFPDRTELRREYCKAYLWK